MNLALLAGFNPGEVCQEGEIPEPFGDPAVDASLPLGLQEHGRVKYVRGRLSNYDVRSGNPISSVTPRNL